jgi:hypothetical protein
MFRFNHHRHGAYYLSVAKVIVYQLKYIVFVGLVVWLQPHHRSVLNYGLLCYDVVNSCRCLIVFFCVTTQ